MNKLFYNPSNKPDCFVNLLIEDDVEMKLESESKEFVVFDGTSEVLYQGDMEHCYIYSCWYRKYKGIEPMIYSIEKYKEMMKQIKETYNI